MEQYSCQALKVKVPEEAPAGKWALARKSGKKLPEDG
jgi:hypothetical protein